MTKLRDQLNVTFNKEMDRKNFLKYGGEVVLALLGVAWLIRLLSGTSYTDTSQKGGYGSSRYND